MARKQQDCKWPGEHIEATRKVLNDNRPSWPQIAARACVNVRYLRAFARRQIYCPPADRFMLIDQALVELGFKKP